MRQRPSRIPKRPLWQNALLALFGLGAGFGGAVGLTLQAFAERSVGERWARAPVCAPGEIHGCRLTVEATVINTSVRYARRSPPVYDVSLHYLGGDHYDQQLIGGHGFSQLSRGEPVIVEVFDGHLLQVDANGKVMKLEWSPGRWWWHLIVAAFCLLGGAVTVAMLVGWWRARRRHRRAALG